jgi:hypothetical protein
LFFRAASELSNGDRAWRGYTDDPSLSAGRAPVDVDARGGVLAGPLAAISTTLKPGGA